MFRKPARREVDRTTPDHRPMILMFRKPGDELDAADRSICCRLEEANPTQDINWRWNHGPVR